MYHYTIFLGNGTSFSITAADASEAKSKELTYCGVKSQASLMTEAEAVNTPEAMRVCIRRAIRLYRHTSKFTSAVVVGSAVTGISEGHRYRTEWSGIYVGIQTSEWTGEPVHSFRKGYLGVTYQEGFQIPVSQFTPDGGGLV